MRAEFGWGRRVARRIRALLRNELLDRELAEEIQLHLELEAEELARTEGLTPGEARRRALIAFGGVDRYREVHRDVRGWRWLEDLGKDVRYSLRSLRRSPGFSLAAVSILALGIGASAAMFSAVHTVMLRGLPYPEPDQLLRIYEQNSPTNRWAVSTVDYRAVESLNQTFAAVGAVASRIVGVSAGGDPQELPVGRVTAGFLQALKVTVASGRSITPEDNLMGAPPVALIGQAYALRTFGGAAGAIGRPVTIDGAVHTVVGVLPSSITELAGVQSQLWPALQIASPTRRGPFWLALVARRAPGVSMEDARRDLARLSVQIFPLWAAGFQDSTARLTPEPLDRAIRGNAPATLAIFSGAVGLVLIIAIANVVNLMLVRISGRWREVLLRTTLGATRGRLIRMLLTESIVLTAAGALFGLLLGVGALRLLAHIAPDLHGISEARLGWAGALFAALAALGTSLIIAAYPIILILRPEKDAALRDGNRSASPGKRASLVRAGFVVAEFALALPLLAGAGLLLNSFLQLQRVDPGFDPTRVLTVAVRLPSARYPGDSAVSAYWASALPRILGIPGVVKAGLGSALPPDDQNICCNNFDLADRPVAPGGAQPVSPWANIDNGYFDALGVELLDGRRFTPADTAGAPPVVIVSRSWAEHYFPGEDALGRHLVSGGCTSCPRTTIVGVVGDVKYIGLGESADVIYDPVLAGWPMGLNLIVRTSGPPSDALPAVREALHSVDPGIPLEDAAPMEDRLYQSMANPRRLTALVSGFAGVALTLAAIGIFGMLSYTVAARRREIGVRMALGASRQSVMSMIIGRGMFHAGLGAGLGLVITLASTRPLATALFNVSPSDPTTLATVTGVLLAVAALACWLAARQSALVHPMEAIRAD